MHKNYGLNELREMFLKFFETKGHLRLPSFSLIPQNDASLLLINSGMAPMKPWFTGEQEPPRHRVTTCQKCIRTGDIENIGKTDRHGTYFEMLGNFSFGDYFKKEAIPFCWEFLTKVVGLEEDRLYPSIYLDDDEAFEIWNKDIGIPTDRIFRFGKEDNFWEHGAGPCGPCSEVYYDRGEEHGCGKPGCTVGCDCDRYIEVWNNVFSQFVNDGEGHYTEMLNKNIDTGMGLERLACVCQNVNSLFDVDTVMNITHKVSEITGAHYGESHKTDVSLRVITDHIRSSVMMICDGILPSNEGRGYVLRRLLRRAARHGKLLGVERPFLHEVVDTVIHENECAYPDLREKQAYITKVIRTEEENFARTIDGGMKIYDEMLAAHKAAGETVFSGADAFKLYDTYGFPVDLTAEMAEEAGMSVDREGFDKLMEEQRVRARKAREALGDLGWAGIEFGSDMPATEFVGYAANEITDAKKNLRDSVICALDPGSRGVMVVFGGHVIAGTRAKKNKTISYDAFASVNFPALALVQGDRLVRYVASPWPTGPVEFGRALNPKVFLLKLTPGLGPELIPAIFQQYDCVIVESFGVGGIPQRLMDAFAEELGDYDKTHKILILTTQVTYEGSDVGIYEVGKRVKNRFRFLEAHDMTIEAVVTKVMWLLAQNCENFDQLQQRFYRQINFDTFYH